MTTIPKVRRRAVITGAPSSGAGEYPKTRQYAYESMRMGQTVAELGALYAPYGTLELVEPARPTMYRLGPRTTVDDQSTELLWPLGHEDIDALAVGPPYGLTLDDETADTVYELLANYWVDDTQFDSSFETIFAHPAARGLVSLGKGVVRLALRRLDAEPERWSWVLAEITGAQPIPPDAQREDASGLWTDWLRQHDWI